MNWAAKQRQLFIANFLKEYGHINRSDIMGEFSIAPAQATRDLQVFIKNNPDLLVYNITDKCYELRESESPAGGK